MAPRARSSARPGAVSSRVRPATVFLLAFCALAPRAQADPPSAASLFTDEIVVSANLTPTDRETTGASVTVIGADEIAKRNKTSVTELLRTVPGIDVVISGGVSSVFVRGADNSHTLVLVDGVRVNAAGTGEFDFADLRVEQIERIEVLRGAQSSLYGSEAIGGVINIVTRRGAGTPKVTAAAEAGLDDARRVRASFDGAAGAFDWRVSAARERAPGYTLAARAAGDDGVNPYRNTTAAALVGLALPGEGRAELSVRRFTADRFVDDYDYITGRPIADPNYASDRQGTVGALSVRVPVASWWSQTVRVGANRERLRFRDPDAAWKAYRADSRVASLTLQSDLKPGDRDTLTIGYAYENRRGSDEYPDFFTGLPAHGYDETVAVRSVFAQHQWSWGRALHLTAAARHDDHTVFGAKTTWRVTGSADLPGSLPARVHASYGTGFKAPTFVDLFYVYSGNRDLRPETSTSYDLGVASEFAEGRVSADVTGFVSDIDDLIDSEPITFRRFNIARAKIRGIESTLTLRTSRAAELALNYTFTDSENPATGRALPLRARHRASASLALRPGARWSGMLAVIAVRDRVDLANAPLDNYVRVDASAEYTISKSLTAFARAENVLDREYEEIRGFRSPGLTASVGIGAAF